VQATLSSNRIFIGDKTNLSFEITYSNGYDIETIIPDTVKSVGLEFVAPKNESYWDSHDQVPGGTSYRTSLSLQGFQPDTVDIPPIPVLYSHDGVIDTAYTLPLKLTIFSVEPDSLGVIEPILPILEEAKMMEDYQNYLILAFLTIFGITILLYFYQKKKMVKAKNNAILTLSSQEKALQNLTELDKKQLWQKGKTKLFCAELSYILRHFLEDEYQVPALENTTLDILQQLENQANFDKNYNTWKLLLQTTDLVKFSNAMPDTYFFETAFGNARQLING
jgi:hypothetical protein